MNTFNKKSLYVAIAAIGAVGAGSAQAVNIATDGLGNALIYPYYTVNNNPVGLAYNTLLSVVNTTASTKVVKMRFREGRNSREVLDFNIFLSPFDVWTSVVTPTAAGGGHIATSDNSCTVPKFPAGGVDFRNLAYSGSNDDGGGTGIARSAEGYVEVFEMATYTAASATAIAVKHDSTGVPKDCTAVQSGTLPRTEAQPVQGGLFGGVTIVNPAGGGATTQDATPLANFYPPGFGTYSDTGSTAPSYADASPISGQVSAGTFYRSLWTGANAGVQAVTSVLMANQVYNEYVLDTGTISATEWVLTSPTKYAHTDHAAPADAPYTTVWSSKAPGACEGFTAIIFNREEGTPQVVNPGDFSPQPGPAPGTVMCWEVNLVAFNGAAGAVNLFGSQNRYLLNTSYTNGWAVISYNDSSITPAHVLVNTANTSSTVLATGVTTAGNTVTYSGLPVIGFAAETFNNTALTIGGKTYLSTFGAEFAHRLQTKVQ